MMWDGMNWGGWGMGLGWIFPLAVLGLIGWGVASLARASARSGGAGNGTGNGTGNGGGEALNILKARYAKGELTREEFETMRREVA